MPVLALATAAVSASCTAATGTIEGDDPKFLDPCSVDAGPPTWRALYTCYFGPNGAGCGSPDCHGAAGDDGEQGSGFVCGHSAESCWMGTQTSTDGETPIVAPGVTDPTMTVIWGALRKPGNQPLPNNMPQSPASYVFSQAALDQISAWIEAGAQNN